ncbi:MAG TPA: hypothetical protein VFZ59_04385 [Verrucomicrobiae bacterium]|nr:hypothetical protein [Verrucomicrobiae bacterium]
MPEANDQFRKKLQWSTALKAGLATGGFFLLFPLGSPWSAMSFESGAVMGRSLSLHGTGLTLGKILLHLALAIAYTFVIATLVKRFHAWRAVVAGGLVGLILYGINLAIVSAAFPQFLGMEGRVAFTHFTFGFIAAALYKGMARPRIENRPAA